MAFKENKLFNSLTPSSIYKVSRGDKDKLNKVLGGYLSSMAFVKEDDDNRYFKINPATHKDKKIILNLIFRLNIKIEKL